MTGKLFIDEIDAWTVYGVFVVKGGYSSLIQFPALKTVEFNSWPEEDGVEVDLSAPVLDARNVTINFCCVKADKIGEFFELLQDGSNHTFNFAEIGKTYTLRMVSQPSKNMILYLDLFSLEFIEDMPFEDYTYVAPTDLGIGSQGYSIDAIDLSEYGFYALKGTKESVLKASEVKQNLLVNISIGKGQVYDALTLYFKEKDVVFNLAINAPDLTTFWTNYEALFYKLIQPNERILYVDYNTAEYPCYYKSLQITKFRLIGDSVLCEMALTLCVTSFRRTSPLVLFAFEDGSLIITEDGYAIDLSY